MQFKKIFVDNIGVTVGLLVAATLVVYAQSSWSGPTAPPPGNNTPAPLNVSAVDQLKDGGLGVGRLAVFGNAYVSGNVGVGVTAPSQALDVGGYVRGGTGLCIGDDCRTSWPAGGGGVTSASGTNLKVLRGNIGSAGKILSGDGFTAGRDTKHKTRIQINFNQSFSDMPVFTANAIGPWGGGDSRKYVTVYCYNPSGLLCQGSYLSAPPYRSVLVQVNDDGGNDAYADFGFTVIGKP